MALRKGCRTVRLWCEFTAREEFYLESPLGYEVAFVQDDYAFAGAAIHYTPGRVVGVPSAFEPPFLKGTWKMVGTNSRKGDQHTFKSAIYTRKRQPRVSQLQNDIRLGKQSWQHPGELHHMPRKP